MDYDAIRAENVKRQNDFFRDLGLLDDFNKVNTQLKARKQVQQREHDAEKAERLAQQRARRLARQVLQREEGGGQCDFVPYERRLSARLQGREAVSYSGLDELETEDGQLRTKRVSGKSSGDRTWVPSAHTPYRFSDGTELDDIWAYNKPIMTDTHYFRFARPVKGRQKIFGHIPGVPVGFLFYCYEEMRWAGMQYETCAGISTSDEGAYAVVLNGGYEDDIDHGDVFTMTGSGGRSLKGTPSNPKNLRTGPQTHDQELVRRNLALSLNADTKKPVRVIRGYKCMKQDLAPPRGFRYDGLYELLKYDFERGLSGFMVYRFYFKRLDDQPPAPWHDDYVPAPLEPDLPAVSAEQQVPEEAVAEDKENSAPEQNSEESESQNESARAARKRKRDSEGAGIHKATKKAKIAAEYPKVDFETVRQTPVFVEVELLDIEHIKKRKPVKRGPARKRFKLDVAPGGNDSITDAPVGKNALSVSTPNMKLESHSDTGSGTKAAVKRRGRPPKVKNE